MTTYPGTLDTFTTKADTTDDVMAGDINALQAAIVALETELGTLPKGAYADVKARLAALAAGASPLTPTSLHATYGDHFAGASLDAKWTRVTYVSGDETYQQGGGTWLQIAPRAAGAYYYQAAPAGDFTLVGRFIMHSPVNVMFGLEILSSAGTGVGSCIYSGSSDAGLVAGVTSGSFSSGLGFTIANAPFVLARNGVPFWLKLTKTSGVYTTAFSFNGTVWSDTGTLTPTTFTPARIGFGGFFGTAGQAFIDFFDVQ